MVETIGLSGVERVDVVSTTPVGMGACCIVDKSEPSAQCRRRIQGRTPESAPLACWINIDLVRGMSFQLLTSSEDIPPSNHSPQRALVEDALLSDPFPILVFCPNLFH